MTASATERGFRDLESGSKQQDAGCGIGGWMSLSTVRAEPVEAQLFTLSREGKPFDKLRANGVRAIQVELRANGVRRIQIEPSTA